MNGIRPKDERLRLDPASYEERQQVLRSDGWRCQSCGMISNLEVHHQEFRSFLAKTPNGISLRSAHDATRLSIAKIAAIAAYNEIRASCLVFSRPKALEHGFRLATGR